MKYSKGRLSQKSFFFERKSRASWYIKSTLVSKVQSYYRNRTMTIKLYDNVVPDDQSP
jgi:hypothetical protein